MQNPLYGLILAGGKSTRMGRDKGTLAYHNGKDQVSYLHEVLSNINTPQEYIEVLS